MSDLYRMPHETGKTMADISLVDDIGTKSIDRAKKILAGFPRGAEKAIGSALKRAAQSAEAYAAQAVGKEYYVKAGDFKSYTKTKKHYTTTVGSTSAEIEFRGYHIPLIKFDTRVSRDGRVVTRVMRSSARSTLDHVFSASMGSHVGLYERVGEKRLPVQELFGPSTVQMMSSNDDVEQEMGDKLRDVFDSRLEHEITAILNGWRK